MSNSKKENSEAVAQQESKDIADSPTRYPKGKVMELAIQVVTALAVFGGIAITLATYYHKQSLIIWSVYFTVIMVLLVPFLFWQKRIWEQPNDPASLPKTEAKSIPTSSPTTDPTKTEEERPYIGIKELQVINFAAGQKPAVQLVWQNFGRTPAFNVSLKAYMDILPAFPKKPEYREIPGMPISEIFIPVGKEEYQSFGGIELPAPHFEAVQRGTLTAYIYGIGRYDDSLKRPHSVRFCFYYRPEAAMWSRCAQHNDTD
jgi:hypothetical protein